MFFGVLYLHLFFPTLTCGVFVFSSVSAFRLPPPLPPLTHSLTHSLTHTLTHSFTHSPTHPLTHPLTHSLTPHLLRGRRGIMCTAKGSDVRPGVPWVSASFAWQAWHNVHCQGVGCTPWRPLGLRRFCVAGVAQCALPRGRITDSFAEITPALTHSGVTMSLTRTHPRGTHCHSLVSPPLLRGRRHPRITHAEITLTQSLTHSSPTHSLPPSPTHPLTHFHFTSLHFTSLHFTSLTHSLTHITSSSSSPSSSSCASDVYQPQGMQKEFTKCAAALERVQNITLVSGSMVSTPSFW